MSKNETKIIFVGCLRPKTTEEELVKAFSTVGKVEDCMVLRDKTGKSKQCAFISYETPEMAKKAVEVYDETKQCNTIVHVELRTVKERRAGQVYNPSGFNPSVVDLKSSESDSDDKEKNKSKRRHHHRHHRRHRRHSSSSSSSPSYSSSSSSSDDDHKRRRHHRRHRHHRSRPKSYSESSYSDSPKDKSK